MHIVHLHHPSHIDAPVVVAYYYSAHIQVVFSNVTCCVTIGVCVSVLPLLFSEEIMCYYYQ